MKVTTSFLLQPSVYMDSALKSEIIVISKRNVPAFLALINTCSLPYESQEL